MSDTPIRDFIETLIDENTHRLFMPGHKGSMDGIFSEISKYDITEIQGADYLYKPVGIIRESEKNAEQLFGAGATCFSVNGSSQSIFAMIKTAVRKKIAINRNCHISAINTVGLLGIDTVFINNEINEKTKLVEPITPEQVEKTLKNNKDVDGVFVTSVDYFGQVADIKGISEVCEKYNVKLLTDNAHGVSLAFLEKSIHPIHCGADFCCDSLHKTENSLTGTALLHMKDQKYYNYVKKNMEMFSSTSPSYILMLSIEDCIARLRTGDNVQLIKEFINKNENILRTFEKNGFDVLKNNFSLRIVISGEKLGYNGDELAKVLRENNIEPEYVSENYIVLLPSLNTDDETYENMKKTLSSIEKKDKKTENEIFENHYIPVKKMTISHALKEETETVPIDNTSGRVIAETVSKCPPGIAVIVPGEIINENIIKSLKNTGNLMVKVVK